MFDESGGIVSQQNLLAGSEGESHGTNGNVEPVGISKDAIYRTTKIADGNALANGTNPIKFTYDTAGNFTGQTYPLLDGTTWQVDAEGNPTARIDGRGNETDYTLAADDSRVTGIAYVSDPTRNATLQYDQYSRLTQLTDYTGTVAYSYDDLDELMSVSTTFTGFAGAYAVSYTYNPDGSRASMTTPKGTYLYSFNDGGDVTRVGAPWTGGASSWTYQDNGLLSTQTTPKFDTAIGYNARGFATSLLNSAHLAPTQIRSYYSSITYDALGNLTSAQIAVPPVSMASHAIGSLRIQYDAKFRPIRDTRLLSGGGALYDNIYTSDNSGNPILSHGFAQPVNANNQIIGSGYVYDREGNPTTYAGTAIGWDQESHPLSVGGLLTQEFRINGERAWKDNRDGKRTYYLYDGSRVICEIAGDRNGADNLQPGSVYGAYSYGPFGLTSRWSGVAQWYTLFSWDPFGNPIQRHRQFDALPADTCIYDSNGVVYADQDTNSTGTLPVSDPIGGLSQWGDFTDEELRASQNRSGLITLTDGGYYDPTAGRYVNRFGDIENEYKANILPWKVFSGMGQGAVATGGLLLADQLDGPVGDQLRAKSNDILYSGDKIDRTSKGMGFVLVGSGAMYVQGRAAIDVAVSGLKLNLKPRGKAGMPTSEPGIYRHSSGMRRSSVSDSHWRSRARAPGAALEWSQDNLARMRKGKAPQIQGPDGRWYSYDLSHIEPYSQGGTRYREMLPWDHARIDKYRGVPPGRPNP